MTTALATRNGDAPLAFGSRDEIESIANRIRAMLPSARLQDWQLAERYRKEAERNLNEALYKAAQLCVFYRLVPGEDVHIIPIKNQYVVDMGVETWKKAADRYAQMHGITYHVHVEKMPDEMLKKRRGKDYDPNDYGVIGYLWRSDKAPVYEIFGAKEAMTKGYGVWRVKANWNQGKQEWQEDSVQAHRTPQDVAERRARKMALKAEFSLDSLLAANPGEMRENQRYLEDHLANREKAFALPTARRIEREEDGGILFPGSEQGVYAVDDIEDAEYTPVDTDEEFYPEPEPEPAPQTAPVPPKKATTRGVKLWEAVHMALDGDCLATVDKMRQAHADSDGTVTPAQHQYLVGIIDNLCGQHAHRDVLSVLCMREVTNDNPEGNSLGSALLKVLPERIPVKDEQGNSVKGKDGKVVYQDNASYRKDIADCIKRIWTLALEVRGQLPMELEAEAA